MGIDTTAWLAYGIPTEIHPNDSDELDRKLRAIDGVSYLKAGDYDADTIYLVTQADSADLGAPERVQIPRRPEVYRDWDERLNVAIRALGITTDAVPAWRLIAAQS